MVLLRRGLLGISISVAVVIAMCFCDLIVVRVQRVQIPFGTHALYSCAGVLCYVAQGSTSAHIPTPPCNPYLLTVGDPRGHPPDTLRSVGRALSGVFYTYIFFGCIRGSRICVKRKQEPGRALAQGGVFSPGATVFRAGVRTICQKRAQGVSREGA